ncbi:MAG TPA: hypothetical protein VIZ43_12695 [Trebonia sp.]
MAFSVSRSRPFRSLGLYRSSGKHAAPKGFVPESRPAAEPGHAHRPAHAATMPRLTGPHSDVTDVTDADQTDAKQQAA